MLIIDKVASTVVSPVKPRATVERGGPSQRERIEWSVGRGYSPSGAKPVVVPAPVIGSTHRPTLPSMAELERRMAEDRAAGKAPVKTRRSRSRVTVRWEGQGVPGRTV